MRMCAGTGDAGHSPSFFPIVCSAPLVSWDGRTGFEALAGRMGVWARARAAMPCCGCGVQVHTTYEDGVHAVLFSSVPDLDVKPEWVERARARTQSVSAECPQGVLTHMRAGRVFASRQPSPSACALACVLACVLACAQDGVLKQSRWRADVADVATCRLNARC